MIPDWKDREIRRLLYEGKLSQRKIAIRLGVSRGTVSAVAAGKRPDNEAMRRKRDDGFVPPGGPPVRCRGCGGKAKMPCLACYVRKMTESHTTDHPTRSRRTPSMSRVASSAIKT